MSHKNHNASPTFLRIYGANFFGPVKRHTKSASECQQDTANQKTSK